MTPRSITSKRLEERADFLVWLPNYVERKYLKQTETEDCFSPLRDFVTLSDIGFPEKHANLIEANRKLNKKMKHILGDEDNCCERCLRTVNAYALFHGRNHSEIFTEGAKKIIWLALNQREKEHEREIQEKKYHGDGLYLIQIQVPSRGCLSLHETHLLFYDEKSIRHGQRALKNRVRAEEELIRQYPGLRDLVDFGGTQDFTFPGSNHRYFCSSSHEFLPQQKGSKTTTIDIISRDIGF